MMGKVEEYRETLRGLEAWDPYLLSESGLPGSRGNLELTAAVVEEGGEELFLRFINIDARQETAGTAEEFLVFCGIVGLGKLVVGGARQYLKTVKEFANHRQWRFREAAAMALQRWGEADMEGLLIEMESWSRGTPLEQRAAAAALCEPRLLTDRRIVRRVLDVLDDITDSMKEVADRKSEAFRVLSRGLSYCWSVAVAAEPTEGKRLMEKWFAEEDADIRRIMRENLKKKRLARVDPGWVNRWKKII